MITANASASFSKQDSSEDRRKEIWARLEQEYRGDFDDAADISTVMRMVGSAMEYKSAMDQLYKDCVYASIVDGVITVTLAFYVWPSDMDLEYGVTVTKGEHGGSAELTTEEVINYHRSFDVIFDGSSYVELPYNFTGDITPSMPAYTPTGKASHATFEIVDSTVEASESVHTVFRADGTAHGYRHTVELTFSKYDADAEQRINNVNCEVTLTYQNEDGETEVEILQLDVPKCASDLLEWCESDKPTGCPDNNCDREPTLKVWYSTCEDETILRTEVVKND